MKLRLAACLAATLLLPALAFAQDTVPPAPAAAALPAWDQLSAEQRELLIAPVRERWNASPGERQRMLERAARWKAMPAGERERARHGMRRFENMSPEQRKQARAIFHQTRDMTEEQRHAFMQRWKQMTTEQRQEWLRSHPAPEHP